MPVLPAGSSPQVSISIPVPQPARMRPRRKPASISPYAEPQQTTPAPQPSGVRPQPQQAQDTNRQMTAMILPFSPPHKTIKASRIKMLFRTKK